VIAVWITIGWSMKFLRPLDVALQIQLPAWVRIPGLIAILVGAVGVLACGIMLSTRGIGTMAGKERLLPKEFLAVGPFRFVRNPMSLGAVVLLVGLSLWQRSTVALGLTTGLFGLFHAVIVNVEEPGLEKKFGESYREYKRKVPRWLPRWRSRSSSVN
jgi:protein-S-isoprenylcysteine O-methyltransferase Ste14